MWMGYLGMKAIHANLTATGFSGEPNEVDYPFTVGTKVRIHRAGNGVGGMASSTQRQAFIRRLSFSTAVSRSFWIILVR